MSHFALKICIIMNVRILRIAENSLSQTENQMSAALRLNESTARRWAREKERGMNATFLMGPTRFRSRTSLSNQEMSSCQVKFRRWNNHYGRPRRNAIFRSINALYQPSNVSTNEAKRENKRLSSLVQIRFNNFRYN